MKLEDYKLIFVAVGLIGVLFIASPALADVIRLPSGEHFSELYLLGPEHMTENYQFNIAVGQNYSIYVGVTDHLGSSAYYVLYVKLKNQTDLFPNATTGTPSSLSPLYESRFALEDGQSWESPVNFSISAAAFSNNQYLVKTIIVNNIAFNVNKPADWAANATEFNYQLLFELLIYNPSTGSMNFNNRYVTLQLNLTKST
jgi:uncharacterized membrane protein